MHDNKLYGAALITGSIGGVGMMLAHPTGHDLFTEHFSALMLGVHLVALLNFGLWVFGLAGLSRELGAARTDVTAAVCAYALALGAAITPIAVSAFLAPVLEQQMLAADPAARALLAQSFNYTGLIINAFARTYVVTSSMAILFWSVAMIRTGKFQVALAAWGLLLAASAIPLVIAGYLRMDVHGFGLVMLTQGIWFIGTGVTLLRTGRST
jgi:hypothetical protein